MNMKAVSLVGLLSAVALLIPACAKNVPPQPTLEINPTKVEFTGTSAEPQMITVTTNQKTWTPSTAASWLAVIPVNDGKTFYLKASDNIAPAGQSARLRNATVTVSAGKLTQSIQVSQDGEDAVFTVTGESANLPYKGGSVSVSVEYNSEYTVSGVPEWIEKQGGTKSTAVDNLIFVVGENSSKQERTADIVFACGSLSRTITIRQNGYDDTVRVLAIGNSFSTDAVVQDLPFLFKAAGYKSVIGNMYIGSCTLEMHANNSRSGAKSYEYTKITDGVSVVSNGVSLETALKDENWDYVSVQEGGGWHGYYDLEYKGFKHSMEPNLTTLINYVLATCANKDVKILFHSPWSAQIGYTGVNFSRYDYDQVKMHTMICDAVKAATAAHPEIYMVMNSMDAVQNGRTSYLGDVFNRDGWHLSLGVGRYTVGCLWFEKLTGQSVVGNTYIPDRMSQFDAEICQIAAHQACEHPYQITDLSGAGHRKDVLAKWYFSPARGSSDGYIRTWSGQDELGVWNFSNTFGQKGYIMANDGGAGKLSYVQVDKTRWTGNDERAGVSSLSVSNGSQPQICGAMPGDYWLIETKAGYELKKGDNIHTVYLYVAGNTGTRYWMVEYMDGDEWKPAFASSTVEIKSGGKTVETISYNLDVKDSPKIVTFDVVLENDTRDFKIRQTCCSTCQLDGNWYDHPNTASISRIAGDPNATDKKPMPEIDIIR